MNLAWILIWKTNHIKDFKKITGLLNNIGVITSISYDNGNEVTSEKMSFLEMPTNLHGAEKTEYL